jgi:hypothetical protein
MPWLIEWRNEDTDPPFVVTELADTPTQAEEIIRRLLTGRTFTSVFPMPRTEPAFDPFFREYFQGDIKAGLKTLNTLLSYPLDDGTLFIERIT